MREVADVLVKYHDAGQLVPGQGRAPGPDADDHGGDLSLLWFTTFAEAEARDESRPFRVPSCDLAVGVGGGSARCAAGEPALPLQTRPRFGKAAPSDGRASGGQWPLNDQ